MADEKHKIGPKEAAAIIHDDFRNEHADPRFIHHVRFAGQVCDELKVEKSPENIAKVMRLLGKANIEGHAYTDFPKWVSNERGESAVVKDEDHEKAFMARPPMVDDKGVPNPEHGHVDPQTGVFVAGMKPGVYEDPGKAEQLPANKPGLFDAPEGSAFKKPEPAKIDATS